jgi:lipopolysaccharide export system protein LptA
MNTRGTRWLILLAIVAVLGGTGYLYLYQQKRAAEHPAVKPALLPPDTNSTAINYEYAQSSGGIANFKVKAASYRQVRDTPNYELVDLELQILQKDHQHYDLIKSAKAQFNQDEGRMFSEGEVEITLDVPVSGPPPHPLTVIHSSGVRFDSKTGKASTEKPARFTFASGNGQCTGAAYDPQTHELHLMHDAVMNMHGKDPKSRSMTVRSEEITYQEASSVVRLSPWSKLVRAETTIDAGPATVNLKDGQITSIDTEGAKGLNQYPTRRLEYSADKLHVDYDDDGNIRQINALGNARMHETSKGATTDTKADTAELNFTPSKGDALLQHVWARGNAQVDSQPAPDAKGKRAESRVLKSNTIEVMMRPDGQEIDQVKTHEPGTLEFLPNAPDQHRRLLNGATMVIAYGDKNLIKSYHAEKVTTITFPAAAEKQKNPQPSKTASNALEASFNSKGELATMKQWDNFTYEEGDRRAKCVTASMDNQAGTIELDSGARFWDATGSTDADHIHMDQKSGDYRADGHVMTSRLPDKDPKKKKNTNGELLDGDQPIQGMAPHMTSANHNKFVHYDGGAVLWQGADRIEAQTIDIDREKHLLTALNKVTTSLLDEDKKDDQKEREPASKSAALGQARIVKVSTPQQPKEPKPPAAPVYTVVNSDRLVYTDTDRVAHYTGSVLLIRPGLTVRTDDLEAYLNPKDSDSDSRLNRAFSNGNVEIIDTRLNRQRTGKGDHGEYYTEEDKLILRGGLAELHDSLKGDSRGTELTYYTSDDRLLITGSSSKPVASRLKRKTHTNANPGNR